ncbi:MAG TPA: ATP-binding protein [Chloroflexota bacterium]
MGQKLRWLAQVNPLDYGKALLGVALTIAVIGFSQSFLTIRMVYLVPLALVASRWGRGPAIVAVLLSFIVFDYFFIDPVGSFVATKPEEAIGLALLLGVTLFSTQLVAAARQRSEALEEAALARRSDELKTTLLRAVSHSLRTPLATIKAGASGLLQEHASYSEADRRELLQMMEAEADRLDRIVGQLLDASRLEGAEAAPTKHPEDLVELIDGVVRRLQPGLKGRPVDVAVPWDLPLVHCDYAQIDQVVTNLVENAALHTPPGSPITVKATFDGEAVRTEVVDQGPGIPRSERARLFEAFERGASEAPGSGLGLAIARGLVEAHGGELWVEDAPGGGAAFVFRLPAEVPAVG